VIQTVALSIVNVPVAKLRPGDEFQLPESAAVAPERGSLPEGGWPGGRRVQGPPVGLAGL